MIEQSYMGEMRPLDAKEWAAMLRDYVYRLKEEPDLEF